jgi:hypothetical protein
MDVIAKREARLRVQDWGELIYRSLLSSGGRLVLSNPARYLNVSEKDKQALISSVGSSLLDLILKDDDDLEAVFSREGLEVIIKAALNAVGEHPEILIQTDNQGVKRLLSEMAKELSQAKGLLSRDILPEVGRLVIEKSGKNLELFWPDLKNRPEANLMLTAAKTTLLILSRPPKNTESWKPLFSSKELLAVTERVLDELVANPGWLITEAGEVSGTLEEVLEATLDVLRRCGGNRLNPAVGVEVIQAVLNSIALRQEFVSRLPNGQPVISAAVEAIIATIFKEDLDAKVSWQLVRAEIVTTLTQVALEKLAASSLDQEALDRLQECINAQITAIVQSEIFDMDSFTRCLEERLGLIP